MKENNTVVEKLNQILAGELTAIDQYLIHSKMYKNFGYNKLYKKMNYEVSEEREHARLLIERILFLKGTPKIESRLPIHIGKNVSEMIENDLALEKKVVHYLRVTIAFCESLVKDFTSSSVLIELLKESEQGHILWLEQQKKHIDELGLQKYLMTCL